MKEYDRHKIVSLAAVAYLCLLPFFSWAQSYQSNDNSYSSSYYSLYQNFERADLSEEELHSFEQRAIQKVKDFHNYLQIVGNPTYEQAMREQAAEMAFALFQDTEISVSFPTFDRKALSISQLLEKLLSNRRPFELSMESIQLQDKLAPCTDGYKGRIQFQTTIAYFNNKGYPRSREKSIQFSLQKREKQFGATSKKVWEIILEEIQTNP